MEAEEFLLHDFEWALHLENGGDITCAIFLANDNMNQSLQYGHAKCYYGSIS